MTPETPANDSPTDVSMSMEDLDDLADNEILGTESNWKVRFSELGTASFSMFKEAMFDYLTFEATNLNESETHHVILEIVAIVFEFDPPWLTYYNREGDTMPLQIINERQWQLLRNTLLQCELEVTFRKSSSGEDIDEVGDTEPPLPDILKEMRGKDYWRDGLWNRLPFHKRGLPKTERLWSDMDCFL